jgi:hypothetical protein
VIYPLFSVLSLDEVVFSVFSVGFVSTFLKLWAQYDHVTLNHIMMKRDVIFFRIS